MDHTFFQVCKEEYKKRRDTVIKKLRKIPGVVVEEPMGAFYVMASLPVDDTDVFQRWLLETFDDQGDTVMFAPGAPFYLWRSAIHDKQNEGHLLPYTLPGNGGSGK